MGAIIFWAAIGLSNMAFAFAGPAEGYWWLSLAGGIMSAVILMDAISDYRFERNLYRV